MALDELTMGMLRAQVEFMCERAAAAGVELLPDAYVFSDAIDGAEPWRPGSITRFFGRLRSRVGLEHLDFHYLRKFMETYGQNLGFSPMQVAMRAGHDPSVGVKHYTGNVEEVDRVLATAVASLLVRTADGPLSGKGDMLIPPVVPRIPLSALPDRRLSDPLFLQMRGRLAVPDPGDQMDAVEGAALSDAVGEFACMAYAGASIVLDRVDPRLGHCDLRDVGDELAGHGGAGEDHYTRVDVAVEVDGVPPGEQLVEVERNLDEQEVGCSLPGWKRLEPGRHSGAEFAGVSLVLLTEPT